MYRGMNSTNISKLVLIYCTERRRFFVCEKWVKIIPAYFKEAGGRQRLIPGLLGYSLSSIAQIQCTGWKVFFPLMRTMLSVFLFPRRLIKSTFFLVTLFGLQYILFAFLPVELSNFVFKIWTFAELALSSTQVNTFSKRYAISYDKYSCTHRAFSLHHHHSGFCGRRPLLLHEWGGMKCSADF